MAKKTRLIIAQKWTVEEHHFNARLRENESVDQHHFAARMETDIIAEHHHKPTIRADEPVGPIDAFGIEPLGPPAPAGSTIRLKNPHHVTKVSLSEDADGNLYLTLEE